MNFGGTIFNTVSGNNKCLRLALFHIPKVVIQNSYRGEGLLEMSGQKYGDLGIQHRKGYGYRSIPGALHVPWQNY